MLSKIHSLAVLGMECEGIEVEVDITNGLGSFTIVGLGDAAVQESRERVRSAIKNSGYRFPMTRITVNLAPADIRKNGALYDLPIALGLLMASGQLAITEDFSKTIFVGELALDGRLRPVSGVLPMMMYMKDKGYERIIVPYGNAQEASLIQGIEILAAETFDDILKHFLKEKVLSPLPPFDLLKFESARVYNHLDFSQIKGQFQAKRALEIVAAGSHNILLNGSPGSGKTLMTKTLRTILPLLTLEEALEVTKIYSVANELPHNVPLIMERPFRTVHHTASGVSIIGGGRVPMPGEISLAHKGVLFLDELPEFPSHVLEVLRQPLEDKQITVTRTNGSSVFPADFMLVAAMNPCPCGYYNVPNSTKSCSCAPTTIQKYQKRISGPLLDRIDLYIDVSPVKYEQLQSSASEESSDLIRERVQNARNMQTQRFKEKSISANSQMGNKEIKEFCRIPEDAEKLLETAVKQMHLSVRGYNRVLKVARTIADLDNEEMIHIEHVAEALQYRRREET